MPTAVQVGSRCFKLMGSKITASCINGRPRPQVAGLDPEGPAHRAGIQPGDLLVAADDQLGNLRFFWGGENNPKNGGGFPPNNHGFFFPTKI